MKKTTLAGVLLLGVAASAFGADGVVEIKSAHAPKKTLDRLEALVK